MTTIQKMRSYRGPATFLYGFRPFFLFGAVYAGAMIPLWFVVFAGDGSLPTGFAPRDWYVHGMLFGCVGTAIAGFLLIAIPNWTGCPLTQDRPLDFLMPACGHVPRLRGHLRSVAVRRTQILRRR